MRGVIFALVAFLLFPSFIIGQNWGGFRTRAVTRGEAQFVWNKQNAAHLARRAGFSASPETLELFVEQGFEATLDEFLNYEELDNSEMETALAAKEYQLTYINQNDKERPFRTNMARSVLFRCRINCSESTRSAISRS